MLLERCNKGTTFYSERTSKNRISNFIDMMNSTGEQSGISLIIFTMINWVEKNVIINSTTHIDYSRMEECNDENAIKGPFY